MGSYNRQDRRYDGDEPTRAGRRSQRRHRFPWDDPADKDRPCADTERSPPTRTPAPLQGVAWSDSAPGDRSTAEPQRATAHRPSPHERNGSAIAGFILSLISLVPTIWIYAGVSGEVGDWFGELLAFAAIIFILMFGGPFWIPAVICCSVALVRARREVGPKPAPAIAGLILCGVGTILLISLLAAACGGG